MIIGHFVHYRPKLSSSLVKRRHISYVNNSHFINDNEMKNQLDNKKKNLTTFFFPLEGPGDKNVKV